MVRRSDYVRRTRRFKWFVLRRLHIGKVSLFADNRPPKKIVGVVMDSAKLWLNGRHDPNGTVELDEGHHRLLFDIENAVNRERVKRIFEETGDVSPAWTRSDSDEWQQQVAEPFTSDWFIFVVVNRLSHLGYRADFQSGTDQRGTESRVTGSL